MESICAVLCSDDNYAIRLSSGFNARKLLPFDFRAFSDVESFIACKNSSNIKILVVDYDKYNQLKNCQNEVKGLPVVAILVDDNEDFDDEEGVYFVKKYQAADLLISEVTEIYRDKYTDKSVEQDKQKNNNIIMVYSPCGNVGKTVFAVNLANVLGNDKKTLYICLDEYADMADTLSDEKGTLSDVIYYLIDNLESKINEGVAFHKVVDVINRCQNFDYIYPAGCSMDIKEINTHRLIELIDMIDSFGSYERIVIDVGALVKEPWRILGLAKKIIIPYQDNEYQIRKYKAFERLLKETGYDYIFEYCERVMIRIEDFFGKENKSYLTKTAGMLVGKLVSHIDI